MHTLVLASASPRRAALLREMGVEFAVCASDVPEEPRADELPEAFARRAAREKGAAVAPSVPAAWVLSADTIVVVDGDVLGKPADAGVARAMLRRLSGRAHEVVTAVVLSRPGGVLAAELAARSTVEMREIGAAEIDAYIATGEPFDRAGAYAVQAGAAAFVRRVVGSYSNVVGLPVDEVRALLGSHGLLRAAREQGARAG